MSERENPSANRGGMRVDRAANRFRVALDEVVGVDDGVEHANAALL